MTDLDTTSTETETPDLRAALEANFAAAEGDGGSAGGPPAAAPEPAPEGPARDEHGRFAPKEGVQAAPNQTIDQAPAPAPVEAPSEEPIRPPASWSAPAKAKFAALDPEIQREILKRENDVTKGFEEKGTQLKRYEAWEAAIAPVRPRLALNGLDETTYLRGLVAADDALNGPNRLQAFLELGRMYGINPAQFAQMGQPGAQPQAQRDPYVAQLEQELGQLKAQVSQSLTAQQQAEQTRLQAEIQAFADKNIYYENVRPQMAALLRSGAASDMQSAYDMACWANPEIRSLLAQSQESDRQAQNEQRARTEAAKKAAGSIAGSPVPGSAPARQAPASIRASLEDAFRAAS